MPLLKKDKMILYAQEPVSCSCSNKVHKIWGYDYAPNV